VVLGIAGDMLRVCPDACLLNYSNPMAMLPWAVYEGTGFSNVFGCATRSATRTRSWPGWSGSRWPTSTSSPPGSNHQAFVLRFEHQGSSLYPRLREVIDASPELQRRVRVEIFRRFGYFPTESSEHSAEYVPWFMRHDDQVEQFRIFVGDYLARSRRTCASSMSSPRSSPRRSARPCRRR